MNKNYFPEIDGLRAVAVLLVFFFHLKIPGFEGGFIGVDIFFVISGYLITSIYFYEINKNNKFNFYQYFSRRVFRLLPALIIVVFSSLIIGLFIFSPIDLARVSKTGVYSIFFLSNIFFFLESSYWAQLNEFKIFIHTWSLGIEMSFYLLMPIFLFLILKLKNNLKILFVISVIVVSLIFILYLIYKGPESQIFNNLLYGKEVSDILFYLIPFRFFEFLFGTIIYLIPKNNFNNSFKIVFFGFGFFLIILTLAMISPNHKYQSIIICFALIGSSLMIYFRDAPIVNKLLNNKVSVFLGLISYSLYLVHWPTITFAKYSLINELTLVVKLLIIIFSILISFMIYKFIETPFRKESFRSRLYIAPITIILMLIFSNHLIKNNGLIDRLNSEQKEIFSKIKNVGEPCKRFHSPIYKLRYKICLSGDEKSANIILLGDSNATTWFPISKKIADKYNMDVVNYRRVCNSFPKNSLINCNEINPTAKILIIGSLWFGWQTKESNIESNILKYINNINDIRLNKNFEEIEKIIIFGQIPVLKIQKLSIMSCLLRPKYFFDNKDCGKNYTYINDKDNALDKYRKVNHFLETYGNQILAKNFDFIFVDPIKSLCEENNCIQYKNSELFYANNNHLSTAGANFVYEKNKNRIFNFLE